MKNSFINKINLDKASDAINQAKEKGDYFVFSPKTVYAVGIVFCLLIVGMAVSLTMLATARKYSPIAHVEELIDMGDYKKAEELSYTMLYSEGRLLGYSEGALLRIAGEYASRGRHNDATRVLERLLSARPESFAGRTGYVVSSALAGDAMGAIKGVAEIPNINAFVPNIGTIVRDYSIGRISNTNQLIEQILRGIFTKN
ncbi:hypothetical protein [Clostridium formicaceticum]|uniref:Uncharacterized protein n=1 Tax=Clostridium formicaceticum TaxID=1497 RepID=A0AAC9RHD1_9CLOT|nr:hypothetical protein [Clostridium formicaceticum]AOY75757.1 hypothetical protein BJL90_07505 [Clostridium formicaceticum]ARE86081.1 hypothetical protein CLFO_03970 [Clostridium formicaceticum]